MDVVTAVVKRKYGKQRPRRKSQAVGWSAVFRRLEHMLDVPKCESGLILADAGNKGDKGAVRTIAENMGRARMARASTYTRVLNGVIFRDSRPGALIRLADIAAHVVHRRHRKGDRFRGRFDGIRPKSDAVPSTVALKAGDGYA